MFFQLLLLLIVCFILLESKKFRVVLNDNLLDYQNVNSTHSLEMMIDILNLKNNKFDFK